MAIPTNRILSEDDLRLATFDELSDLMEAIIKDALDAQAAVDYRINLVRNFNAKTK